jgi:hypothetical protein
MRTAFYAAVAAFALAAAAPASAVEKADNAQVGRVLERAGLVGVWGTDCDNAGSTEWETIAADDRGVFQSIEGSDDAISTYDIVSARRLNSRDIRMDMVYVNDEPSDAEGEDPDSGAYSRITVVYRIEGDKQMTWSSVAANGDKLITSGVFAGGEQRSEWYHRCPNGRPVPTAEPDASEPMNAAPANIDEAPMADDVHKAPKT